MKKKNILILLIISMLFCISSVKAKEFSCEYELPDDLSFWEDLSMPSNVALSFSFHDNNEFNSYSYKCSGLYCQNGDFIIIELKINKKFAEEYIEPKMFNNGNYSCPETAYICKASLNAPNADMATNYIVGLTDDGESYMQKNPEDADDSDLEIPVDFSDGTYYLDTCFNYDYVGSHNQIKSNACTLYENLINEMKELDNKKEFNEYNRKKDELITFCQNVISNGDYEKAEGKINKCYSSCLKINDDFAKIENLNGGEKTCGFSQRLIVWVGNIIKWIKYIIPVIVIVLGIIDFIKAIASSSDDEMKKAQGRFIKRLVAAALIFIIPFIIEFILDKTGFSEYVSGCGVIDL